MGSERFEINWLVYHAPFQPRCQAGWRSEVLSFNADFIFPHEITELYCDSRSFFSFCRHQIQFHFVTSTSCQYASGFNIQWWQTDLNLVLVDGKTPGVIWLAMMESNIFISRFCSNLVNQQIRWRQDLPGVLNLGNAEVSEYNLLNAELSKQVSRSLRLVTIY